MSVELQQSSLCSRRATWLSGVVIVLAASVAFYNSFSGPLIFDGDSAIINNPTIRHLGSAWTPPHNGGPVTGRPVLNFSFALNYALGGLGVRGYHAGNLAIHVVAGLALFGVLRRTLLVSARCARFRTAAGPLALIAALLWLLHPLQTSAITYVAQRGEALAGMFYLLTLYSFVRSTQSRTPGSWSVLAVIACFLGMASKEVMVSAPLTLLLYDRTFVAGSFRGAWRQRRRLYLALAATWLLLAYLVVDAGDRAGSSGFSTDVSWWSYLLTQSRAIVLYLKLSLWPHPLVFDYGPSVAVKSLMPVLPFVLAVVVLMTGTVVSLRRWPAIGFLGYCFLAILAPSSSVVPVATELIVEHRMYLPVAVVMVLLVLGMYLRLGRGSYGVLLAVVLGFALLTFRRNEDYRAAEAIWTDTVAKHPENARGQFNLGLALYAQGRLEEAIACYRKSIALWPKQTESWNNLGLALAHEGRVAEAITDFARAIEFAPDCPDFYYNLGNALLQQDRWDEAIANFTLTTRLQPDHAAAHNNLGYAFSQQGRWQQALAQARAAVQLEPDNATYGSNLALLLATCPEAACRNGAEAVAWALKADRLHDGTNYLFAGRLAAAYAEAGRFPEAVATARRTLQRAVTDAQVAAIREQLDLYEAGRPFHGTGASNGPAGTP